MKQILTSLLAAYTLTNGQTTVAPAAGTTVGAVSQAPGTTAGVAAIPISIQTQAATTAAPGTGSVTTAASIPAIIAAASTTAAPVNILPVTLPQPPVAIVTTSAPVVPAPVITPAPVTAAPTTAAPTYNSYCPMPTVLASQHGVQSGTLMSSNQGCISPHERAVAFNGKLQCSTYSCCQCAEIQCGDPFGLACDELVISDSGAVGNQNINVLGDMTSAFGGNSFAGIGGAMNNGAQIRCNGLEACKASKIYGKYVGQMDCSGDMGCAGSNVRLEDPGNEFQFQCNGMMSCMNMNLELVITPNSQITELGTIEFNGQQSAQGMTITITNQGWNPILLQNLECMNPTACPNLRINIIGQVFIENCDLQHMNIQTAGPSLLAACQGGNNFNQGNIPFVLPPPQQPQYPQQPIAPAPAPQQQPQYPQYPQQPAVPSPPAQQPQVQPQQPQQQQAYNPYVQAFCNPMSPNYDYQDCLLYGGGGNMGQQQGFGGMNLQNPYCNPASGMFDIQDCYQYSYLYPQQQPQQQQPQYNPYAQQQQQQQPQYPQYYPQYPQYPQYNPWI